MSTLARTNVDPAAHHPPPSAWIAAHQTMVWRFLRYLGAPADRAEDLAQDTFVAALRHGLPAERDRDPGPWLRATARNFWIAELRRQDRRPSHQPLDEDVEAAWLASAGTQGGDVHKAALEQCLETLDGRARDALHRRYALGESRGAMASGLGLSEAGVKALLRRVRDALRDCMNHRLEAWDDR